MPPSFLIMQKRNLSIAVIFSVIVLASAGGLIYQRSKKEDHNFEANVQARASHESPAKPSRATAPLPPENTPFRLVADNLKARALKGDAGAACRLALEYQKCNLAQQQISHADDVTSTSQDESDGVPEIALPLDKAKFYANLAHCEGTEEVNASEISRMWRRSAENGNLAAMVNYAAGNAFSVASTLDTAEELIIYRKIAPQISQSAINRGSGLALLSLAAAYQPENQVGIRSYLSQAVGADIQQSLTLYKMAKMAATGSDQEVSRFIDDQIEKLDRRASALQRSQSDYEARERVSTIGTINLPSARDIAWLRIGSAPSIDLKDCED
ncbi:hypothetical protein AB8807_15215 [Xanthomonas campestris pv. olitorii]|uniref:Sel1 repeat family protein n=2 Tax=Xanthomonas TaxID=338 RepID=A0AB73MMW4_9XANT|nr:MULTISPECIES: hypothetical protein [Xanthomonas]WVK02919.1 hypothetical protein KWH09_15160 [Xanthomonas campestris pv. olitorii]OOW81752.1 hypothetical protein Xclt_13930 [Xanthomonas axonopodis pv. clitoriae]PNV29004.1 hypothetical protein xavtCFBP7764_12315 [Xanthomonas citri]WOP49491.1 hypothetical protein R2B60_07220 [Xanthomonas euvesicatoria]WOP51225.1 hypothetical protein R5576_14010 [Xanthomonas euvesicatoria]